jgi:hypothetical protein
MSETVADPAGNPASGEPGTAASGGEAPAPADPTASGAGASGGVDYEAAARTWQSRYDQAQAELASLKASAASSGDSGNGNGGGNEAPDPSAVPITQADLIATLGRVEQMRSLTDQLRQEFPNADPSVFQNALSHQSPEAYLAAARQSHEAKTAEYAEWRKKVDAEWTERLGPLAKQFETPAAGATGDTGDGSLTLESWLGMSLKEREEVYAENSEAVDKMLNEATRGG